MSEMEKKQETGNPNDAKREKVRVIPVQYVDDFPDHPFQIREDEEMAMLVESIRNNGVLTPILVRRKEDDRYEIISGHRRKYACMKLGMELIPLIVRDISRDEAVIAMVDSNLQREVILPSEKARAYKMKMDAMKRQGKRTNLTLSPVAIKSEIDSAAEIGRQLGERRDQVFRYIRLNELVPELLEMVDEVSCGRRK